MEEAVGFQILQLEVFKGGMTCNKSREGRFGGILVSHDGPFFDRFVLLCISFLFPQGPLMFECFLSSFLPCMLSWGVDEGADVQGIEFSNGILDFETGIDRGSFPFLRLIRLFYWHIFPAI